MHGSMCMGQYCPTQQRSSSTDCCGEGLCAPHDVTGRIHILSKQSTAKHLDVKKKKKKITKPPSQLG